MTQAEQRGDRPTALAQAEAAHRLDPRRPRTLRVIGEAHLAAGRAEEALAPLRALLETRPYDLAALQALGDAARRAGHPEESAEALRRARQLVEGPQAVALNDGLSLRSSPAPRAARPGTRPAASGRRCAR